MAGVTGGGKMEKALRDVGKRLSSATSVRVGFLENATYPDGTPVAMIAAVQEFGAPSVGIPPRPYFRNMIRAKSGEWPAAVAGRLKANDYDAKLALDQAGAAVAGQLKRSIIDTNSPPLKPATIKRKGFAKPLIDTSHMINSVDHEVKD